MAHDNDLAIAISNCNREPIHIPGTIQQFGSLLATDMSFEFITHAADNLENFMEIDVQNTLGKSLSTVLSRQLIHDIRNAAGISTIHKHHQAVGLHDLGKGLLNLSLHQSDDRMILELEPNLSAKKRSNNPVSRVRSMLSYLQGEMTVNEMLAKSVSVLKHTTGYDRAMIYQFLPDGAGEVIQEACSKRYESYLGLRYPASDIPIQVRDLALKTPVRVIANIDLEPISIRSNESKLDLSLSYLRGISSIHTEYLANMGVKASMNIAIVVKGKLWGLFACHHYSPRLIKPEVRLICELFSQIFSLQLQQALAKETIQRHQRNTSLIHNLQQTPKENFEFAKSASFLSPFLSPILKADGIAVATNDSIDFHGNTPSEEAVLALVKRCQTNQIADVTPIAQLRQVPLPSEANLRETAGALILTISHAEHIYVMFFRDQITSTIRWGGNPEKTIVQGQFGPRLQPRASFDEYIELVTGQCLPWSAKDVEAALEIRVHLLTLANNKVDTLQFNTLQRQKQQDLLVAELNHRVKNILALIRSITRQSVDSSKTISDFMLSIEQRITALASAHDLVAGHGIEWPLLRDLFNIEFRPYLAESKNRARLTGPKVGLKASVIPTFILTLHELVSNAVKYGAFSIPAGSIEVSWFQEDGGLIILWRERNGPLVRTPTRQGFGCQLIERAIAYEFDGKSRLRFTPQGLEAEFWLPSELVLWKVSSQTVYESPPNSKGALSQTLQQNQVLIVEDQMLIALELAKTLEALGCQKVITAPRCQPALALLSNDHFHLGVLDIDLNGEDSFAVAEELQRQNIPFLFVTGFDSKYEMPKHLNTVIRLKKPVQTHELSAAIQTLLQPD